MMRYLYPAEVTHSEDGVTVSFPDVPEAIATGNTVPEALSQARDALISALSFYVEEGQPLPQPSTAAGRPLVGVGILDAAKLALHDAMVSGGVTNVELARRLDLDEKAVRRLRDPLHRSHIGQVEAALEVLGRRLDLVVEDAAA
ncbi:type II toxin-antitoxin system HicB family antitoxin [Acidisoma sp. 7E03]